MKKVKHILENKGYLVYSVNAQTSVYEALTIMMEKNISAVLIMNGSQLEGIFTERDYARKLILKGKSSKDTRISDIMTREVLTINPEDSIDRCMEMMTGKKIRHLPVIDNQQVTGMISIGDVVKFIIEDQKKIIEQLENYIAS
jgi:CBS domain-containing protein